MDQKIQFVLDARRGLESVAELCRRYCISRKTGHKWLRRYEETGPAGLEPRTRRPHSSPTQTPQDAVEAILAVRRRHPHWGAKKILRILEKRHPKRTWPGRTTVSNILSRNGMVRPRRRRRCPGHPGRPNTTARQPNQMWTADFKGHFRTRDGRYCYPLTVADAHSRYLLGCQGLASTADRPAHAVFRRLFQEYGLPEIIRTDNGTPFATTAIGRLSRLSVWWIRLGIYPELIEPASPQQNGSHERMHRTLKQATLRPPAGNLPAQQRRFNAFRQEFNHERPHEALGQEFPADLYRPSPRAYPRRLDPIHYPDHFEIRYVSTNGGIRWNSRWVSVSHVLEGQHIGLEEVDNDLWDVFFGPIKLGRFDERTRRITDLLGREARRRV